MAGSDRFLTYWDFTGLYEKNELPGLISLLGEETYVVRRVYDLLHKSIFGTGSDFGNCTVINAREKGVGELLDRARTLPMLSPAKLFLVRGSQKIPETELPRLEQYLRLPAPKTTIVFEFDPSFNPWRRDKKESKEFKVLALLERYTLKFYFSRFKEDKLVQFLERLVKAEGFSIGQDSLVQLSQRLGGNLETIAGELEKLYLLADENKRIHPEDIEQLLRRNPAATIFNLLDSLASRNIPQVLERFWAILETGDMPVDQQSLGILTMLARFFQQAMTFKSLFENGRAEWEIKNEMRLNDLQVKNLKVAHCNYSQENLWQGLSLVGQTEERFKSLRIDQKSQMEFLLLNLCRLD